MNPTTSDTKRPRGRPRKDTSSEPHKTPFGRTSTAPVVPVAAPAVEDELKRDGKVFRFLPTIAAEEWWVKKARTDPVFFLEYMTNKVPPLHVRMWLANIFHAERRRLNFIAPRESMKTTTAMYALAWAMGRAPILTHGLISVSAVIAEARLRMIRELVSDNTRYKNVFPHVYIDKTLPDTQQEFTVASAEGGLPRNVWRAIVERNGSLKDATLFVAGAGGRGIIGRRFSGLLLLDDIIDETYLKDELQEAMMEYIIRTLIPCVKEEGKVINIGTRWMPGDVPERLMNNPTWHTIQIKAIEQDEEGNRRSYWPSYWPLWKLDDKKEEMNNDALFNIMYMNDPSAMTASLFTTAQLSIDLPKPLPALKTVHVGTDFAISQTTAADFNVFIAIGQDYTDNWYLLDMTRFKTDPDNIIAVLGDFCDRVASTYHMLSGVVVERVGFQSLLQHFAGKVRPDLPLQPHVPKGDKYHRGQYAKGLAQQGKLFINQNMPYIQILKSEWLNFPLARHDDTLDAATLVMQFLGGGISVRNVRTIRSPYLL